MHANKWVHFQQKIKFMSNKKLCLVSIRVKIKKKKTIKIFLSWKWCHVFDGVKKKKIRYFRHKFLLKVIWPLFFVRLLNYV